MAYNSEHENNDPIPMSWNEVSELIKSLQHVKFPVTTFKGNPLLIQTAEQAQVAYQHINQHRVVAVDLEGVRLSRDGEICLLSVGLPDQIYLFDLVMLRRDKRISLQALFAFLEDRLVLKVMFDCRGDSDALQAQLKIHLVSVLDLQILDIAARRTCDKNLASAEFRASLNTVLKTRLVTEMKEYWYTMSGEAKGAGSAYSKNPELWRIRPLRQDFLVYSTIGVRFLTSVSMQCYEALAEKWQRKVVRASRLCCKEWRESPTEVDRRNRVNAKAPKM
jgi:exonuclease 3'-5' domain-containing protein 1